MATKTATKPRAGSAAGAGRSTPRRSQPAKTATRWTSRAVLRGIEAGSSVSCAACGEPVKFKAKVRAQQVICNVYVKGAWDRVEHFHAECYTEAGSPHGDAQESAASSPRRAAAAPADAPPAPAPTA